MKSLHINLSSGLVEEEEFDQSKYGYFGGRGLIARFLTDHCDPLCDPLGPDDPLVFTTGYFSGTILTTANRLPIGAKSPLTGGIKESNPGVSIEVCSEIKPVFGAEKTNCGASNAINRFAAVALL